MLQDDHHQESHRNERDATLPDRIDSGTLQHRAEGRVESFQSVGGPFVAAVVATRMPMDVTDPTVNGNGST
jgi:hypothetical protein